MPNKKKKKPAYLFWELIIECDKCGWLTDLSEPENDIDGYYSKIIFNNRWNELIGKEFTCPECGEVTIIEGVIT